MFRYDANININVLLMDSDYFALQCVTSYLAMDRRTRVVCKAESLDAMWDYIERATQAHERPPEGTKPKTTAKKRKEDLQKPSVIVLDADHCGSADRLRDTLHKLHQTLNPLRILCQSLAGDKALINAAVEGGACGYLIKSEVRYHIAWVVACASEFKFVTTPSITDALLPPSRHKASLIRARPFPDLTRRQREVLEYTLLEGMPAKVVADELLIGYETVRGHIRDGYDILRSSDDLEFPETLSEEECAFMRFTRPEDR